MASIDDLLDQLPLDQLAAQLGVDEATAESATRAALPALVQGMQANAQDQERAAALVRAISKHAAQGPAQPDKLDEVDTDDGAKIVNHVFGDNTDKVERYRNTVAEARRFVELVNKYGGKAEVLMLPDAGLRGNTHIPFADLNNVAVADLLSKFLRDNGLDGR